MNDQDGWFCKSCGGHKVDPPRDPRESVGYTTTKGDPPRECEAAQVERALNHRSENYGCTIIVVSFFALLAWVAYLVFQFPPAH